MPRAERAYRPRQQSALVAGAWMMLATVAVALTVALSLPSGWRYAPDTARDVFRPEWLVIATLTILPVYRTTRACWWFLLPAVGLPGVQLLYAVETASARLDLTGLASDTTWLWWVLPVIQWLIFAVAGLRGAAGSVRDRHWERFMRRRLGPATAESARPVDFST